MRVAVHEPDSMGVWSEEDGVVWLPRSLYPRRTDAIGWAIAMWNIGFLDVRCLSRWMVHRPVDWQEWWEECEPDTPGAFRVWRLEQA